MKEFGEFLIESLGKLSVFPHAMGVHLLDTAEWIGPGSDVTAFPPSLDQAKKVMAAAPYAFALVKKINDKYYTHFFAGGGEDSDGDMVFSSSGHLERESFPENSLTVHHTIFRNPPSTIWMIATDESRREKMDDRYARDHKGDGISHKDKSLVRDEYYKMIYDQKMAQISAILKKKISLNITSGKDGYTHMEEFPDHYIKILTQVKSVMMAHHVTPPSVRKGQHTIDEIASLGIILKKIESL